MQKSQLKSKLYSYIRHFVAWVYQIWVDEIWPRIHAYFSGPDHFFRRAVLYSSIIHFTVFLIAIIDLSFFKSTPKINLEEMTVVEVIFDEEELDIPIPPQIQPPSPKKMPPPLKQPSFEAKIPAPPNVPSSQPKLSSPTQAIQQEQAPIPLPPHQTKRLKSFEDPIAHKPKVTKQDKEFFSMLKNLSQDEIWAEKQEQERQMNIIKKFSANERDLINQQISQNWNKPPAALNTELTISVQIKVDEAAQVKSTKIISIEGDASPSLKKIIAVSVERAVRRSSPLKLPEDKYHLWKKGIILNFYTNRG